MSTGAATFELRTPPGADTAVEYILIPFANGDVVHRAATEEDRQKYAQAYAEFKNPSPAVIPEKEPAEPAETPKEPKAEEPKTEEPEAEEKAEKGFFAKKRK